MEENVNKISEYITLYGFQILAAAVIFVVGKWLARAISNGLEKVMSKKSVDPTLCLFVKNLSYIGLMAFVILAALSKLGIQTASFIAVLGAAGLAVGLALQGSLSNFAAGVLLILFKPYKVGDFVDLGGAAGTVKEIHVFNTILASPDNVFIVIPNAQATSGVIKNFTTNPTRRVDLVIGVSYDDDLKKTREVIESVVNAQEGVLQDPAPTVAVSELGDSSVNFVVRPWCKREDYWAVKFALTEKIKVELENNGITIPFPQRDVHVYNATSTTASGAAIS